MGMGHYQLRFLDRYRARWHADLRDSVSAAPEMADINQSLRRSDDAFRGDVRRHLPRRARWPCLDGVVSRPGPEQLRDLAELPQPADVGRVRGLNLFHRLGFVLVHRI